MRSTVFVSVSPGDGVTLPRRAPNRSRGVGCVGDDDARRRHLDGASQAAGPGLQQPPAVAHPGAQRPLDAAVQPPGVAREHDPGVAAELRALAAGERDVGRDVVAQPGTIDRCEQRADVLGDALRQHAARVGPRGAHGEAVLERVRPAVAVVVDLVEALPRRDRQHDEDALLADGLHGEGDLHGAVGRADLEEVHAGLAARRLEDHARARAGPVRPRVALAHPAHAPRVAPPGGDDEELGIGRRLDRRGGRPGGERHDLHAALAPEAPAVGRVRGQRRRRGADVARLVARAGGHDVGPGRQAAPVLARAVPRPGRLAGRDAALEHELRGRRVRPVDEHAGVAAGHEQAHPHRRAAAVGERLGTRDRRGDRADREDARLRRRHVLHDRVGQRDGPPLPAQRDPVAVGPVLHRAPVVVAAVPGERQAAVGLQRAPVGEAAHPVAVARDDVDRDVVVLLDREGDAGPVLAPVGVGREERRREDRVHRRRRALEALGGEERPERRDHERGERETGQERHSRCTDPLATTAMPGGAPANTRRASRITPP